MKIKLPGVTLNYEIHGKKGAPWITLSHSLACSTRMWDAQTEDLSKDFQVLVYDTRGHGLSEATPGAYDVQMLASDVYHLLQALGIAKTHFVGLSMVGMTGAQLALSHPEVVDHLVLADTGHAATPAANAAWQERIDLAVKDGLEVLVEPTLKRWFTEPFYNERSPALLRVGDQIRHTPLVGFMGCIGALTSLNLTERLKDIKHPTLAIAGEQDASAGNTMFMGEQIAGSKSVLIPSAAHIANVEQSAVFTQALRDFLS